MFELYSVPADGSGAPVKLNGTMLGDVAFGYGFGISPDSRWVVYRANPESTAVRLYGVPIDGSAAAVPLDLPPEGASMGDTDPYFVFPPAGEHVVLFNENESLHSAPFDGGDGALLVGGYVPGIEFAPDGTRVFYRSRASEPYRWMLYVIPIDGGAAVLLNAPLQPAGDVLAFEVSPDGTRVAYAADQESDGVVELYARASDGGGTVVKLNAALPAERDVGSFWFEPGGQSLVYTVDLGTRVQLYRVASDGSAAAVAQNSIPGPASAILFADWLPLPEQGRVLYRAQHSAPGIHELWSLAVDGSLPPSRLNAPLVAGGDVLEFAPTPDRTRVVYRADADSDERYELFSAPLESRFPNKVRRPATPPPVRLNGVLPASGDVTTWRIAADGSRALYLANQERSDARELYSVPIAGGTSVRLNEPLDGGERVSHFDAGGERVAFITLAGGTTTLHGAPLDGAAPSVTLNPPLPLGPPAGDVHAFELDALGKRALYLADQDADAVDELYSVRVDRLAEPVKLNATLVAGGDVGGGTPSADAFAFSPDGQRVLYSADQDTPDLVELYVVPSGGGAATKLSEGTSVLPGAQFTPDGARVVYRATIAPGQAALFSVLGDGSASPERLDDGTLGPGVTSFRVAPDSARVVYLDESAANKVELWSAPADASAGPVRLNGILAVNRDVASFALAPDGARVLFLVDATTDGRLELFSVPTDRSSAPVELSAGAADDVASFAISADSARVAFVGRLPQPSFELYGAPLDGSASAVELSGTMVAGANVVTAPAALQITPDSVRAVFAADRLTDEVVELFSVPLDASAAPVRLNSPLVPGGDVGSPAGWFAIGEGRVVYAADQEVDERHELYSALVAGGGVLELHPALPFGRAIESFALEPRGARLVYVADQETEDLCELFRVPIDASSAPEKLSGPIAYPWNSIDFRITPDSRRVLYRTQGDVYDVFELYATLAERTRASDEP